MSSTFFHGMAAKPIKSRSSSWTSITRSLAPRRMCTMLNIRLSESPLTIYWCSLGSLGFAGSCLASVRIWFASPNWSVQGEIEYKVCLFFCVSVTVAVNVAFSPFLTTLATERWLCWKRHHLRHNRRKLSNIKDERGTGFSTTSNRLQAE